MLANPKLQSLIKEIDCHPMRYDKLEMEIENDRHFEAFIILLMQTLGYFDKEGRFIDPLS
jgi:hypothetical protein